MWSVIGCVKESCLRIARASSTGAEKHPKNKDARHDGVHPRKQLNSTITQPTETAARRLRTQPAGWLASARR